MLKVGAIGGGHILTHRHLPVLKVIDGVTVSAVCDQREDIAKRVAEQFGIARYYTSVSEMLGENLDIVDVCTPPRSHIDICTQAMERGCHVLVEKPMAMTIDEVDRMLGVARREHVKLCVVHQNLYNPAVQEARRLVDGGSVGKLLGARASTFVRRDNAMCTNRAHWCHRLPGGIFFELLPHPLYLLQAFLKGIDLSCVVAKNVGASTWMISDEVEASLGSDGAVASVRSSCNSAFHGDALELLGTEMGLEVDLWGRTVIRHTLRTEDPFSVGKANLRLASQFVGILGRTVHEYATMLSGGVKISAHYGFIRAFIDSVREDQPAPTSDDEARENVRLVAAICEQVEQVSRGGTLN